MVTRTWHKYFNSTSFSTDAEPCTSCRCSNTNEKFFHTSDFPDKLGFKTIPLLFSRNRLLMSIEYLVPTFRLDKTPRSTTEYTDECLHIVPALSQTISRYPSPTCNVKLASFSAASCWCGVIWIWWYQRHSTACDGTVSASDAPVRLLRPVHQRLSQYSQVSA